MGRLNRFGSYTQTTRQLVNLDDLKLDGGTQPREAMDEALIDEYAERMSVDDRGFVIDPEGTDWQKLVVFEDDDEQLWLADGFHRTMAAKRAGITSFQADFREGPLREAITYSLGVNANHGKRRTNADKRRAVERALGDPEWIQWADARIARLCKVSRPFVTSVREELELGGEIDFQAEVYRENGQAQYRERPETLASAATNNKKASSKKKTSSTSPSSKNARVSHCDFDALSELSSLDRLIAYPVSEQDWRALGEHLDGLLAAHGTLLCHLPQQEAMLFRGPAILTENASLTPRLVYNSTCDRFFACFHKSPSESLPARASSQQLLASAGSIAIVGESLDQWPIATKD